MKKLCFIILATMLYIPLYAQICIVAEGYTPVEVNGIKKLEICPGETVLMKAEDCANPAANINPTWTLPGGINLPAGFNEISVSNAGVYSVKASDGREDKIEISLRAVTRMSIQTPGTLIVKTLVFCDNEILTTTNSSLFTNFKWFFDPDSPLSTTSSVTVKRTDIPTSEGDLYLYVNANNNDCIVRDTFQILKVPKPVINLPSDTSLCPGKSLILANPDLTYGNSEAGFSPQWIKPASQPKQTAGHYLNTQLPGTYILKVSSSVCSTSDTIEVIERELPQLEEIPDTYICEGGEATLKAVVNNDDGSGLYDFRWSIVGQGAIPNNSEAEVKHTPKAASTNYRVTVYNQYFCEATANAHVYWYTNQVTAEVAFSDTSACGLDPVTLQASGTSGLAPYSYKWFPETNLTGATLPNPSVIPISQDTITYSVVVTDAQGCRDTSYVTVKTPDMRVDIQEGPELHICEQKSVQLNAKITGGQPPYSYKWINDDQTLQSIAGVQALNNTLNITRPGNLTTPEVRIEVTDERGCPVLNKISINVYDTPTIQYSEATRNYYVCAGDAVQFAEPDVSGGTGVFTYNWTGPSLSDHSKQPTYTPAVGETGTKVFSVRIEDARVQCPGNTENILVTIINNPYLAFVSPDTSICEGDQAILTPIVKASDLNYEWKNTTGDVVSTQQAYTTSEAGKYLLTVREPLAGCSSSAQKSLVIKYPATYATIAAEQSAMNNEGFSMEAQTDDSTPLFAWTTTGKGTFDDPASASPVYSPVPADSGLITFTLVVTGSCTDDPLVATYDVLFINYVKPKENIVFVPNVFAPFSSNEKNRSLMVFSETLAPDDFTFVVYNRWGQIVYETSNLEEAAQQGWNGQLHNSGTTLKADVYTYLVKGKFKDGNTFERSGSATLMR